MSSCTLIGILDNGWASLSDVAHQRIGTAAVVIGAGRTLNLVRSHLAAGAVVQDMDGALARVPEWIGAAQAEGQAVVILATGDPLCHGIASWLNDKLDALLV